MAGLHFDTSKFDRRHLRNQKRSQKKLQSLFDAFYKEVAKIGSATGWNPDGEASGTVAKEFYLRDYPQAQKQMRALLQGLCEDITTNIEDGNESAFDTSMAKNEALVSSLGVSTPMPTTLLPEVQKRCETALSAFQGRKVSGMGLSERVWAIGQGMMPQIEMALELGLSKGRNAASLSRDVRSYLNEPERLFRRVRDKDGILRLSKNAKAYHPGQGVYRSSYKNALRLTVTENNMAYRSADHAQWNGMPFVVGIEIQTSGNHPIADICDELKGTYPKEFKFTGWHPFCRCFATPKLCSREELNKWARMSDEERAKYQWEGQVKDVPKNFTDWIKTNEERIANAKSLPYFIKDNYKYGNPAKGFKWEKELSKKLDYSKPEIIKTLKNAVLEMPTTRELIDITTAQKVGMQLLKDSGVTNVEIATLTEGFSAFDRKNGVVTLSNVTIGNNRPYNLDYWYRSALATIKRNKSLCMEEEYAIEALEHERTHASAKGWKGLRDNATNVQIKAVEAATQLKARMSYEQLLNRLGVEKALHTDGILTNGFSYNTSVGNLLKVIDLLPIGRKQAVADITKLLQGEFYETFERRLINYLMRHGMKKASKCVKHLDAFEEDFDVYLRM